MTRGDRLGRGPEREVMNPRRTPITSYYSGGRTATDLDRNRLKTPRSYGRIIRLLPSIIAVLVIVGSIFFSLTLSTKPSVEIVGDGSFMYREPGEYADVVADIMNRSFMNKTKLTARTDKLEQELLDQFPELRAAALRLPVLGRKPTLVIDVSSPYLLLASQTQSFVLDKNGFAVAEVKQLAQEYRTNIPLVQDKSSIEITLGRQILPSSTVQFIRHANDQLTAAGLKASSYVLPTSVNELDIFVEGLTYFVKTDTAGDVRLQLGGFLATKNHLEKQGITPAEYIDVRVEEKVFYK